MRFFKLGLISLTLAVVAAVATPIVPLADLGLYKQVTIQHNLMLAANTGGLFDGTISPDSNLYNFWCVDGNNFFAYNTPYRADLLALNATTDMTKVTKGLNSSWADGFSYSALQRYEMAAWLITQYVGFPSPNHTDDGSLVPFNNTVQNTIWGLLNPTGSGASFTEDATLRSNALANYLSDPFLWAVVSGPVDTNGNFVYGVQRDQTFLVELGRVPEPATYMLLGVGLLGLGSLRRLQKKS